MSQTESNRELNTALEVEKDAANYISGQLEQFHVDLAILKDEGKAAERQAFMKFCKRAKVKQVSDFEAQLFASKQQQVSEGGPSAASIGPEELNQRELPETESELISFKLDLKNAISKCQADLKFNEQLLEFKNQMIASLEACLSEERVKLQNLQGDAREGAADDNQVERLQAEYHEQDAQIGNI